ncbi:MAG TPA: clostripain-related cysteine peptidase [Acidimicrobiales bacterium]|nr:clostripain-related cysteine peptidase [Acidimicrobiales bacterium]
MSKSVRQGVAALVVAAGAIAAASAVAIGGSTAGAAQPGWTVLVYVAADNNLEPFAIPNLMQMASVGSGPGLDIEAFIDRSPKNSDAPLANLGNWSGTKVVQVNKGSFTQEQDLGNVDSGSPTTLTNFISSAAQRHPSDKLALIIWDHGAAWLGTALDEQTNHIIALPALQQALSAGLKGAGKAKFEMLGFDACLMSSAEVLGALAPLANWITASAELEPGHGWDYSALGAVAGGGGSGADLGKAIANAYQAYATSQNTSSTISLAVVNSAAVPALTNAVNGAGNALSGAAASVAPAISGERAKVLSYGRNPDPKLDFNLVDVGALAASGTAPQLAPVAGALNAAVAYKVVGPGLPGGTGVSIYFPPAASTYRKSYGNLPSVAGWNKFLNAYYAAGVAAGGASRAFFGESEDTTSATASHEFTDQGVFLTTPFTVNDADTITDVRIRYGIQDSSGAPVLVGEDPGSFTKAGDGVAGGSWDFNALQVSDGSVSAPVYRKVTVDPDTNTLTFTAPFAYYPDAKNPAQVLTVFGNAVVDLATGKSQRVYFEVKQDPTQIVADTDDAGLEFATSGFLLNPAGALVPLVAKLTPSGDVQFVKVTDTSLLPSGTTLKADPTALTFRVSPLASGTPIYADLAISQLGGFVSTASMRDQVP